MHNLVYFEIHGNIELAIQREKNLKHWVRKWKIELIEKENPDWKDLSKEFLDPRVKPEDDNKPSEEDKYQISVEEIWEGFEFEEIINSVLEQITEAKGEISILLTNDAQMQQLNKQFRGKDKPTNVLSFPQDNEPDLLGDIAMGFETLRREAAEQEKTFEQHFTHLFLHGVLHLLGYDHEEDEDQRHMEQKEVEILHRLNISNPYE